MARATKEQLEDIKRQYGVRELWSWSKYHLIETDLYGWYLRYIAKVPEDRKDGIYGTSGGTAHDIVEKFYIKRKELVAQLKKNEITQTECDKLIQDAYNAMIEEYEGALVLFDLNELKYNRSDDDKNNKIANKYEACMKHFFNNHIPIEGHVITEKFVTCKVGDYVFQGYIDMINEEDGKLYITDWKTSTVYKGKKVIAERGQLVLYAEAMHQLLGIPLDKIVIRWNFMKYVNVHEPQKNGTTKVRQIERNQIGEKLVSKAKMWLKHYGCSEDDINDYVLRMIGENGIDCLPKEVRDMYRIEDCYVEIPLDQEAVDNLKSEIIEAIECVTEKVEEYKKTKDDMLFYQPVTKESDYYFFNLCGWSRKYHKPLNDYLNETDMFRNEGESDSSGYTGDSTDSDLSWLDELLS